MYLQLQLSIWGFIDSPSQAIVLLGHHIQKTIVYIIAKSQAENAHVSTSSITDIFLDQSWIGLPYMEKKYSI